MSVPCGILCLAYALKRFGKEHDITTLFQMLNPSSETIWIADLARIVMECGLGAHLICTSILLDPSWFHSESLLKDAVIHYVQTEKGIRRQAYTALQNYLEKGGVLEYRSVTRSDLETALQDKKIIIACVSSAVFHEDPHRTGGHYVVISGIKDRVWVFFSALRSWGNWVLLVSPLPVSLNISHKNRESQSAD